MAVVGLVGEVAHHVEGVAVVARLEVPKQELPLLGGACGEGFPGLAGCEELDLVDRLEEHTPERRHQRNSRVHVLRRADRPGVRPLAGRRDQGRNPRRQRRRLRAVEGREGTRGADLDVGMANLQPVVGTVGLGDLVSALFTVVSQGGHDSITAPNARSASDASALLDTLLGHT